MKSRKNKKGFSLTEVLIAVGTLAVGMIFIAGIFPAGILFTSRATERTIAAEAASEAFAKVQLIASDPCCPIFASYFEADQTFQFSEVVDFFRTRDCGLDPLKSSVFAYPSTDKVPADLKQYYWYAHGRRVGDSVQVTVFIYRKTAHTTAITHPGTAPFDVDGSADNEITVSGEDIDSLSASIGETILGYGDSGRYRIMEINGNVLTLDKNWQGGNRFWATPESIKQYFRCIGVYQRIVGF